MKPETIKSKLLVIGEPSPLIDDYLDATQKPSMKGYWQYKASEESSNAAQVRWDALQQKSSIPSSQSITGDGVAGLMANLKK